MTFVHFLWGGSNRFFSFIVLGSFKQNARPGRRHLAAPEDTVGVQLLGDLLAGHRVPRRKKRKKGVERRGRAGDKTCGVFGEN